MSISVFDLFKIGIGPSSSHTVGPMIAAKQFINDLKHNNQLSQAHRIKVELFGSLGATGAGHGTLNALLLGLEGESPDSVDIESIAERINNIKQNNTLSLLGFQQIKFDVKDDIVFHKRKKLPFHANGMRFTCFDNQRQSIQDRCYYSIGGGFIIDENQAKNKNPIIQDDKKLPYSFSSGKELLALCQAQQLSIADIILKNESVWRNKNETLEKLDTLWHVMQACVKRGCDTEGVLPGGLKLKRRSKQLHLTLQQTESQQTISNDPLRVLDWVTLYALAVNEENAAGGRMVTAPTNGAAGIIPAVLHYYMNFIHGADNNGMHQFLLTAAAIGMLFKKNASISGAEVGCQGEVGSACSMAAAGLTAVLGGDPKQIENAAEIAMEHHLGLTCDPIGGLVQIPCIERNAVASVQAIHASRIALANDGSHFVSLDKVIKTMRETGRDMHSKYKETSRGGLAIDIIEVPVNFVEC